MFLVPETSRVRTLQGFAQVLNSDTQDGNNGAFRLPSCEPGWELFMLASDGSGWEHVSVHARRGERTRTPTWREMCLVKAAFWDRDDTVVQFHPAAADYVNMHPHVLHLWRPIGRNVETPDPILVGVK